MPGDAASPGTRKFDSPRDRSTQVAPLSAEKKTPFVVPANNLPSGLETKVKAFRPKLTGCQVAPLSLDLITSRDPDPSTRLLTGGATADPPCAASATFNCRHAPVAPSIWKMPIPAACAKRSPFGLTARLKTLACRGTGGVAPTGIPAGPSVELHRPNVSCRSGAMTTKLTITMNTSLTTVLAGRA